MDHYKEHYYRWLENQTLPQDMKNELRDITDEKEIEDRFYRYLEFGTAGLRGLIGAGTNRMNIYTIRRASYGFAKYLLEKYSEVRDLSIAIAYDSRHLSKEFAIETASMFAHFGIKAYLFPELRPTPMLSYAVRHLKAAGGIVITASHNPSTYNGYKVYDQEGCQISIDVAEQILAHINTVDDELKLDGIPFTEGCEQKLIELIADEIDQAYYEHVLSLSLNRDIVQNKSNDVRILFTPLHGAGNHPVRHVLHELGFKHVHIVPEQAEPDPNFSSVSSPNPEDPLAFTRALEIAKQIDADVILGTDPDADRLGVVIRKSVHDYQALNGNQLGSLLLYYILEQKQMKALLPANGIVFKTIVTSDIGRKICSHFNVTIQDTLTGFKFIGEKITQYEASLAYHFLFGYEESYGYLVGDFVRDKDAVQTAMLTAEMIAYYKDRGLSLLDVLEQLYMMFGYYVEDQLSFTFTGKEGMDKMAQIMDNLRQAPLTQIAGIQVKEIKDYAYGIDTLPVADVVKYFLTDESWIVFRPSGTEPKLKCYISAVGQNEIEAATKLENIKDDILSSHLLSH